MGDRGLERPAEKQKDDKYTYKTGLHLLNPVTALQVLTFVLCFQFPIIVTTNCDFSDFLLIQMPKRESRLY